MQPAVLLSQVPPAREMSSAQQALEVLADAIETKTIDNRGLLQVARHSQDLPLATVGDLTRPALPWTADGLCGRLVDRLCNLLKESDVSDCNLVLNRYKLTLPQRTTLFRSIASLLCGIW